MRKILCRLAPKELAHNGLARRGQVRRVPLSFGAAAGGLCAPKELAHNGPRPRRPKARVPTLGGAVGRGLCALIVLALPLAAQTRAGFPWWNSPVRQELGLSPDQNARIRDTVHAYRGRLLDARNNVLKAEGDLEDIMNSPEVDPNAAKAVIDRLASARAASSRVLLEMSVQLRSVLTFDQWRELVRRWDEMQRKKPNDTQTPP